MATAQKNRGEEVVLTGIGVSPGVATGPAFVLLPAAIYVAERKIAADEISREVCRLEDALIETRRQLKGIQKSLAARTSTGDASVFDAHLMVLDDRSFIEEVLADMRATRRNVEASVRDVAERYATVLASVDDDYLRERVADVRDVTRRVLRNLTGDAVSLLSELRSGHIVVAEDLAPSETAGLRRDMVSGLATDVGSQTSHTAVMARALGIPAVVGLHDISRRIATGDELLIDGNHGVLIINPSPQHVEDYGRAAEERRLLRRELNGLRTKPAETRDGHRLVLSANTEGVDELQSVIDSGAEGVGLFRSEYLFLNAGRVVSEDEQAAAYTEVAERLAPAPVIVRTLDIGGDKYMHRTLAHREANPFLGCRSIRLSLMYPDDFKVQLRAILRSSTRGNVKIMYPMISNVGEVLRANELLEEAKRELTARNVPFQRDIDVGIMIEIPGAALTADALARHVRFFSLGTNDLVQYTLAVDRVNEHVAYLYQPTHPAVLALMQRTIEAGHRHGLWVGVCGEMAADPVMVPLLVGLGVDEMSVAPPTLPVVKDAVRSITFEQARQAAAAALGSGSAAEALDICRTLMETVAPEVLQMV